MDGWRVGRKLEFGQNGIDHVFFSLEQIGQKNLVLDELGRFALELGSIAGKHLLEPVARFGPVLFQERNFCQIKTRIPELSDRSAALPEEPSPLCRKFPPASK